MKIFPIYVVEPVSKISQNFIKFHLHQRGVGHGHVPNRDIEKNCGYPTVPPHAKIRKSSTFESQNKTVAVETKKK